MNMLKNDKKQGQNLAYVRVSTVDQNEARQREMLQKYDIDRWYVEKASGKTADRPQLRAMIDYARSGDTVYVEELSRLGRSAEDLLALVREIESKGARFVSVKENFDIATPTGKLQMTMLAAIAEFERAIILERQREGIEIAKRAGKYKGRKRVEVPDIGDYYDKYMRREMTKTEIAARLGISRGTLNRLLDEYTAEEGSKNGK